MASLTISQNENKVLLLACSKGYVNKLYSVLIEDNSPSTLSDEHDDSSVMNNITLSFNEVLSFESRNKIY